MSGKILTKVATLIDDDDEDGYLSEADDVAVVDVRDIHSITLFLNHVVEDATQVNGTKAFLDLETPGTNIDTVVEATVNGIAGNDIGITFADGSLIDEGELSVAGTEVTFSFKNGTTTVADFEAAVAALEGDDAIIQVKTAGTPANVLATADDEFVSENLAGGTDGEGEFDLAIETTIDGTNYAPLDTFDETDFTEGVANEAIEIPLVDANGMPKRVRAVKITLTASDENSKFSLTAVGVEG